MKPGSSFKLLILAVSVMMSGGSAAQTLEDAMAMAYEGNPRLEAARAQLRSVDELMSQAIASARPSASVEGRMGLRSGEAVGSSRPGTWTLSVRQRLFNAALDPGLGRTRHLIDQERASLAVVEQEILLDVARSYLDVMLSRTIVERTISNEQRLAQHLEATEDGYRVSIFTQTDVAQASARLAGARAERDDARGEMRSAAARFRLAVGAAPGTLLEPAIPGDLPRDASEAAALAAAEHPAVLKAISEERAAWEAADVAAADLLPTVDVVAEYLQRKDSGFEHPWQDDFRIEARIVIPLYQGGGRWSKVRQARQQASALGLQSGQVRRQVETNAVMAWHALSVARSRIQAFEEEVAANGIALAGAENELRAGSRTVLDVLDAEQALFASEINLARARTSQVAAAYTLQAAVGRLSAGRLGLPVAIYDVEAHLERARTAVWGYGDDTLHIGLDAGGD